jgi:putative sigma-54 modulation protein
LLNITVTAKSDSATYAVKEYAKEKAQKLSRYYDRLQGVDIIMETDRATHIVEMIAIGDKHRFVAKEAGNEMMEATDLVIDKMERQLSKFKEKMHERHRRKTSSTVEDIESWKEVEEEAESYQDIVDG